MEENIDFEESYAFEALDAIEDMKDEHIKIYNRMAIDYIKQSIMLFPDIDKLRYVLDDWIDEDNYMYLEHVGYATVEKIKDNRYKITSIDFYENQEDKNLYDRRFSESDFIPDYPALVCQWTCCCEDDFTGYVLLPMPDGRYWCFYFQM